MNTEAREENKRKEAEEKLVKKRKEEGKLVLNLLGVPLAKFETDVATLRGFQPSNAFLPSLDGLLNTGLQYKAEATEAMKSGEEMSTSKDKVKQWINNVKAQGKCAQALIKAV